MKINCSFSPITITIENREDLSLILGIIEKAKTLHLSSGSFLSFTRQPDSFIQKCDYIERQLRVKYD